MVKALIAGAIAAAVIAAAIVLPYEDSKACGFRPVGSACDGWKAGRPKLATIAWIYLNDPDFGDWVLAHNEHGQQTCGWRPSQYARFGVQRD